MVRHRAASEVYGGLILVITKGYPVMGIPEKFRVLGRGMLGPVPVPVVIMLVLAVTMTYILRNTPFGRYVYALGGNESAARLVGIRVERIKVAVYAISGSLAALSGMIYVSRMNAGQPTIGEAWLMPSVTAALWQQPGVKEQSGTIIGAVHGPTASCC